MQRSVSAKGSRKGGEAGGEGIGVNTWRPSPEELVHTLRRRAEGRRPGPLRRRARYRCRVRVAVTFVELGLEGRRTREAVVTTCDVSVNGFSFMWDGYIHPGSAVQARFKSLPNRPLLTAKVRCCTHVEGCRHRVGVEFVDASPPPADDDTRF